MRLLANLQPTVRLWDDVGVSASAIIYDFQPIGFIFIIDMMLTNFFSL